MSLSSLDTNLLLYAANEDAAEHIVCKAFLQKVIEEPLGWIIADQVYLELYRALRNSKVISYPLSAKQAAKHISILRNQLGIMHCSYNSDCWDLVMRHLESDNFPYRRTHDAILAATLVSHGVKVFYTRNTKDFVDSEFQTVINPVDP